MKCKKHPNYKGIRWPKTQCQSCINIYKKNNAGRPTAISPTTPGFKCSPSHLFAELGAIMLFGLQPPLFWRKNTVASQEAKTHYKKVYMALESWRKKDQGFFKEVEAVLWQVFGRYWSADNFEKIKEEQEKIAESMEDVTKEELSIMDPGLIEALQLKRRKNIQELFKRDKNGQKEEKR
jgi:hypothetical protein